MCIKYGLSHDYANSDLETGLSTPHAVSFLQLDSQLYAEKKDPN